VAPPVSGKERGRERGGRLGQAQREKGRGGGVGPKGRGWVREEEKFFLPFSFSNKIFQIHFPIEFFRKLTLCF